MVRMSNALTRLAHTLPTLGILAILSACGGGGGDPAVVAPRVVASVEVSPAALSLVPGQTLLLTATALDASGVPITGRNQSWTTSNASVVTVSSGGAVTAITDGIASVTATIDGKSASAAASVRTAVASVAITPPQAATIVGGAPVQLSAAARSPTGATLAGRAIAWASATPTIASVSSTGLVTGLAPGAATITATSEGVFGTAQVQVSANPCNSVRALSLGTSFSGTLTAADCKLSDSTAIQRFEFTLTAPAKVEILMSSSAVDSYLYLTDNAQNVVDEDDDGGTGTNSRILRTLAAGRYFVIANTYDANSYGAYQLVVRPAPAACVTGRTTAIPSTIDASLSANSCQLRDKALEDRYDLNVTARTTIRVSMTSAVIDPVLIVIDNTEREVIRDDDSGAGKDALLEVLLEPGRYTILAHGYPNESGAYRLVVAPATDPCAINRTISLGQTATGTFNTSDCAISDGGGPNRYFQRFGLTLAATTALQIDMASNAVDTYLILQNAQTGAVITENDDASANSTNSRILANVPAGQYIVNATTFEAGQVGAYSLTIGAIQASGITVSISPQNILLQAGQVQQATSTVVGSAVIGVVWQSSAPGIATVSTSGSIRAITPGTASITATSVADPSRFGSVTVTVGQSTTVTNLDIAALYLVQSVQQLDGRIPLVADRAAVARVFLRGNRPGLNTVNVRVRILQGNNVLGTFTGSATPTQTVDEGCCSANINIPNTVIRAGISVLADVDPENAVGESNETDNQYPLSGTPQTLPVVAVPPFTIRFVPVQQNRGGPVGSAQPTLLNVFRSMWPFNVINTTTRQALVIDYVIGTQSFDDWARLVRDIELVRQTEGGADYYYGLVRTRGTSGVLGLANGIPARTAIGVDEGSDFGPTEARLTFAHEMGHTLSLRHSPCGGAAGPEPNYPFADGRTGAYGMDLFNSNAIKLPNSADVMTYCPNQWVSAYNYRKVMDFRQANPNGAGLLAPTSVLMVSGGISRGTVTVDPVFSVTASPAKNDPSGRFVVEGFSTDNQMLFSRRFSPYRVDDASADPSALVEAFVVAVPVAEAAQARIDRIAVREVQGTQSSSRLNARLGAIALGRSADVSTTRLPDAKMQLNWSTTRVPAVMVRDRRSGEVVALVRSGTLDLSQFGGPDRVELHLSDGVKSTRVGVDPATGAIRP